MTPGGRRAWVRVEPSRRRLWCVVGVRRNGETRVWAEVWPTARGVWTAWVSPPWYRGARRQERREFDTAPEARRWCLARAAAILDAWTRAAARAADRRWLASLSDEDHENVCYEREAVEAATGVAPLTPLRRRRAR